MTTIPSADIFVNSLDLDQARQKVCPDLDPYFMTLWGYISESSFPKMLILEKSGENKNACKISQDAKGSRFFIDLSIVLYMSLWNLWIK